MSATAGRSDRDGAAAAEPAAETARAATPAEIAWIALLPCALVALLAILVVGPPLGHLLFDADGSNALWPPGWWESRGTPEPVELGRFVVAALAPIGYAGLLLLLSRRPPLLPAAAIRAGTWAGQVGLLAFAAVALVAQLRIRDPEMVSAHGTGMLVGAAAITLALVLVPRSGAVRARLARVGRERPLTRVACAVAALLAAILWVSPAIDTDRLVEDTGVLNWTMDDAFAVLDGRDPLVDFRNIYAKLLPYPAALAMRVFGESGAVYSLFMTLLGVLALLAVYLVLRRVSRSSLLALVLFVPFVAQSSLGGGMILLGTWPMRYAGAYLMAWLTVRHLDGARPHAAWVVFLVGGLAVVNNLDFGLAALVASAAAMLCARPPSSWRAAGRLAAAAAGGVLGALALVCAFTLVRAGALPQPDVVLEWQPIFTRLGWFSLPMPTLGLHLAIYATFAAASAVAVVRVARAADDTLLTGMLAWSGVFGLGAGAYFAGRSDYIKLIAMFSAWTLALALLAIVCLRALAARDWRAPTIPELLVLSGIALAAAAVPQIPRPNDVLARLTQDLPPPSYRQEAKAFVLRHARPGERVAILLPLASRLAYELAMENVSPYQYQNAIVTTGQMSRLLRTLDRERVAHVFTPSPGHQIAGDSEAAAEQVQALRDAGFAIVESRPGMLAFERGG